MVGQAAEVMMDKLAHYLERIHRVYPGVALHAARLHPCAGQFNDLVVIDDALIFRFPRLPQAAAALAREVTLLRRLRPSLSVPIPDPVYSYLEPSPGEQVFMGYPLLPGEPLWPETLAAVADEAVVQRLAT